MATYHININDAYNVADAAHDGSTSHPFCTDECDTLVSGVAVNGVTLVANDVLRLKGISTDTNLFAAVQMTLTIRSWSGREPWQIGDGSNDVYFQLARHDDTLTVYDGIISRLYADGADTNTTITFYNCLTWNVELVDTNSAHTRTYLFYNCTINGNVQLTGSIGGASGYSYFTDCVFDEPTFTDVDGWRRVEFIGTNIFANTQVLADGLDGTANEVGWNLCTFSYDISKEIPDYDDVEITDLYYYDYDLPIVTTQPERWDTDDQKYGWRDETRYGYGAFYFAFVITTSASPTSGQGPLKVNFTADAPSNIVDENNGYSWDFGDGTTSTEKNPTHEYMPGTYNACVTITSLWGESETECITIYVYENDYSANGRNITKSTKIFRFAIPQEPKQGIGWCEYLGSNYPFAIGFTGVCRIVNENDEERVIVTDCNSFKHYWLGKEDHWVDGANEDYGGAEIDSDILFREHIPPIEATAKLRHSESHANLKPWYKDRRNTGDYGEFGFRTSFKSSMYFREDSKPTDRALIKYFPRKAQIVSDRHLESESLQAGLRITAAPWRLVNIQQWYEQIDTAAAPPEKQMSEKTWAELVADSIIWIGRSIELVSLSNGSHTMPWDQGSNQRTTGSFAGVTDGPDGNTRSAIVFDSDDNMVVDEDIPAGDLSIVIWVRSPSTPCTIISNSRLTVRLVQSGDGWNLEWDDGINVWVVALSAALTRWTMLTIVRHGTLIEVYENKSFVNTRNSDENISYEGPITFYDGTVTGFEPRIIGSVLTQNAIEWLYNDVIENSGNSTCAMY